MARPAHGLGWGREATTGNNRLYLWLATISVVAFILTIHFHVTLFLPSSYLDDGPLSYVQGGGTTDDYDYFDYMGAEGGDKEGQSSGKGKKKLRSGQEVVVKKEEAPWPEGGGGGGKAVEVADVLKWGKCPDRPTMVQAQSWGHWLTVRERLNCDKVVPYVSTGPGQYESMPYFIIMGEQKCGTTFLRHLLRQHPQLKAGFGYYGVEAGETHFFTRAVILEELPNNPEVMVPRYADFFPEKTQDPRHLHLQFDTTPYYLAFPAPLPKRVVKVVPNIRLIAIVREPVERFESAMRMTACRDDSSNKTEPFHTPGSMDEFLRQKPLSLHVTRGMYASNLRRWFRFFDPSRVMVIDSKALFKSPMQVANRVTKFLDLPQYTGDVKTALFEGQNRAVCNNKLTEGDRLALAKFYSSNNEDLAKLIGRSFGWEKAPPYTNL